MTALASTGGNRAEREAIDSGWNSGRRMEGRMDRAGLLESLEVTLQEALEDLTRDDLANRGVGHERKPVFKSM